jgi:acyl-CoA thioesterase FadM
VAPQPYGIRTWFDVMGSASVTMRSELVDGDVLLATARTVLVGFDPQTQTSRRFDDAERAAVTALLRPTAGTGAEQGAKGSGDELADRGDVGHAP